MATLQETVQAVLAELQKQGTNLQDTEIIQDASQLSLILGFKTDGTFIRISPKMISAATTKYVTNEEFENLKNNGLLKDDMEYNVLEDE